MTNLPEPFESLEPPVDALDTGADHETVGSFDQATQILDHSVGDDQTYVALRPVLESVLLIIDEPLATNVLAEVLEMEAPIVHAALTQLADAYRQEGRGFVLAQRGGGWRLWTHPDHAEVIGRLIVHNKKSQLSRAALETLAIVVYKQPVTRGQIADIRAVNPDGALSTLLGRGLIEAVGRADLPGRPVTYGPSVKALEILGINSLDEIPPLDHFAPGSAIPPEPPKGDYRAARREVDILDRDQGKESGRDLDALLKHADSVMRSVSNALDEAQGDTK